MNNVAGHIATLQEKHRKLDEEIKEETLKSPGDHVRITALKREKLRLKDEMERLASSDTPTPQE